MNIKKNKIIKNNTMQKRHLINYSKSTKKMEKKNLKEDKARRLKTILYLKKVSSDLYNKNDLNISLLDLIKKNLSQDSIGESIWNNLLNMVNSYREDVIKINNNDSNKYTVNVISEIKKIEDFLFKNNNNFDIYKKIIDCFLVEIVNYITLNTVKWSGKVKIDYIVPVNYIISKIYHHLLNNKYSEDNSMECINNFIEKLIEYKIINKIVNKKTNQIKYNWVIKINIYDLVSILKKVIATNLFKHIYVDCLPPKWYFNNNDVYNENMDIQRSNNFLTNLRNKSDVIHYTNEKYIKMINVLQEIGYIIDIKLLELFLEKYSYISLKSKMSEDIIIPIYHDYILETYEYINDKKQFSSNLDNKIIKEVINIFEDFGVNTSELEDLRKFLFNKYEHYCEKKKKKIIKRIIYFYLRKKISINNLGERRLIHINDLITLLFLVFYKKKSEIRNLVKIDVRGRMYIQSAVSYINDKFLRLFIHLKMNVKDINDDYDIYYKYFFSNQLIKCTNWESALSIYQNYTQGLDNKALYEKVLLDTNIENLNKIKLMKLIRKKNSATISLDATSSLLQIIGVLTKNKKLLYYTNLIDSRESKDIYAYLINIISNKYENNKFILYYKNRKIVKYVCMTYLYGSTAKYLSIDMKEKFNIKLLLKDLITICNNIINVFKEEFPVIPLLKKIFNEYVLLFPSKMNISYQIWDKRLTYNISEAKKKVFKKELNIHSEKAGDQKNLFYITIPNYENDKKNQLKKKKSAFVNVIHSLDSQICIKTRYNLMKYGIKTLSIHDCFITNIKHYSEVLQEYNKNLYLIAKKVSIKTILINYNVENMYDLLNQFFNNVDNKDKESQIWIFKHIIKYIDQLKKYEKSKKKIELEKIKSNSNNISIRVKEKEEKKKIKYGYKDISKLTKDIDYEFMKESEKQDPSWEKNVTDLLTKYHAYLLGKNINQVIKNNLIETINNVNELITKNERWNQYVIFFIRMDIVKKSSFLQNELELFNDLVKEEYHLIKDANFSLKPE